MQFLNHLLHEHDGTRGSSADTRVHVGEVELAQPWVGEQVYVVCRRAVDARAPLLCQRVQRRLCCEHLVWHYCRQMVHWRHHVQ